MARRPCHSTAALAGGQAWRDRRGRQARSLVLRVSHRRGQHRLTDRQPTRCPSPAPEGLRSWEELRASGPLGLVEELALGSGLCLERHTPPQKGPLALQSEGAAYHHPISPYPPKSRALVAQCRATQPLLAHMLLSRGLGSHQQHPCGQSELFITGVRHPPPPNLGCVWDTHTDVHRHPRTYTHLLPPKGPDKHLVERM